MNRIVILEVRWIAAFRGWSLVASDSSWRSATNSSSALTPRTMSTLSTKEGDLEQWHTIELGPGTPVGAGLCVGGLSEH